MNRRSTYLICDYQGTGQKENEEEFTLVTTDHLDPAAAATLSAKIDIGGNVQSSSSPLLNKIPSLAHKTSNNNIKKDVYKKSFNKDWYSSWRRKN